MHIVDLCEFYSDRGGGVRSYLERLGRAARASGHTLTIVAPGSRDDVSSEGPVKVIRYGAPKMPYDGTYRAPLRFDVMRNVVQEERPDVVQVSSQFAPALAVRLLPRGPLRVYVHHSNPIDCYLRPLRRRLPVRLSRGIEHLAWGWQRAVCRSCDITVVAAPWLESHLEWHGCPRVHAVPFGIHKGDLGPQHRSGELRRRLLGPLAESPRAALLLVAGRLAVDKRQSLLLEAMIQVCRSRPIALVVLGDGPERARLEQTARHLGAATFLSFTRDRAEYAAILASVDALVHGSACETFGFVLAEALASGTPLVVPQACGAAALASADHAELYDPQASFEGVARAIERLLARPRDLLRSNALRAADAIPSSERHFDDLFSLYDRTLRARECTAQAW
jgi:alpha-1,6-mannosyltransferase